MDLIKREANRLVSPKKTKTRGGRGILAARKKGNFRLKKRRMVQVEKRPKCKG